MVRMAKAYCPKCKKILTQVLSSFECLSTWDKDEEYYAPEDDCNLVKRCPVCGTLVKDREKKMGEKVRKIGGENHQSKKPISKTNLARGT
jgi:uncharacterized C2H2 Zn-finger protein